MATDPHHAPAHEGPHEGPIKTPKQLIVAVAFSFVVPVVAIIMLAQYVAMAAKPAAGSDGLAPEAVAQRIRPVGVVSIKDVSDPGAMKPGDQVYAAQCAACHATGAAGAPKVGDAAAWEPRIKQGFEQLVESALKGKGSMGPQGGGDFSDLEIARAVVHIVNQSGGKFDDPKLPATSAQAPDKGQPAAGGTK